MYFCGAVSTTFRAPFSPIILEKRQKFQWPISPKRGNSHLTHTKLINSTQIRGKIGIFDFVVNCPFKQSIKHFMPPLCIVLSLPRRPRFIQMHFYSCIMHAFGSSAFCFHFEVDFRIDTAIYTCQGDNPASSVRKV